MSTAPQQSHDASPDAACSAGCPHCEERVQSWLVAYIEGWHGPRRGWTEDQRNMFYEYYAVLDSFARGFAFTPEPNGESSAREL